MFLEFLYHTQSAPNLAADLQSRLLSTRHRESQPKHSPPRAAFRVVVVAGVVATAGVVVAAAAVVVAGVVVGAGVDVAAGEVVTTGVVVGNRVVVV